MKVRKITCLIWLFAVGSSAGFYSLGILLLFFCILYARLVVGDNQGQYTDFLFSLSAVFSAHLQISSGIFHILSLPFERPSLCLHHTFWTTLRVCFCNNRFRPF